MKRRRPRATKEQLRRIATSAVVLLASTVLTGDRIVTPKQKRAQRRLLGKARLL